MPAFRMILTTLTSVMVMCNALLCMCGPALANTHSSAGTGAANLAPVSAGSSHCHGHAGKAGEAPRGEDGHETPDPPLDCPDHQGGCGCHSSLAATDLKPVQPTLSHAEFPIALLALLPAWHSPAHEADGDHLRFAAFADLPPPGRTISLLRLHCALIL